MGTASEHTELTLGLGEGTFVIRQEGGDLRVGTKTGDSVMWQQETVPLDGFPQEARDAFEAGDTGSTALQLAVQGIVQAFAARGG